MAIDLSSPGRARLSARPRRSTQPASGLDGQAWNQPTEVPERRRRARRAGLLGGAAARSRRRGARDGVVGYAAARVCTPGRILRPAHGDSVSAGSTIMSAGESREAVKDWIVGLAQLEPIGTVDPVARG